MATPSDAPSRPRRFPRRCRIARRDCPSRSSASGAPQPLRRGRCTIRAAAACGYPDAALTMTTTTPRSILTLSCTDRPGIVGAVGTFLASHACNILESAQFGDSETHRFMMRVAFEHHDKAPAAAELARAFDPVARRHGMQWALHDAHERPRVLILVSKNNQSISDL